MQIDFVRPMNFVKLLDEIMQSDYTDGVLYIVTSGKEQITNLCCEETAIKFSYVSKENKWDLKGWSLNHTEPFTRLDMEELITEALEASERSIYLSATKISKGKPIYRTLYEIETNGDWNRREEKGRLCPKRYHLADGSIIWPLSQFTTHQGE